MNNQGRYLFKKAETVEELEQVHQLNYRTFVREIPQHSDPGSGRLIDKFHDKNHYFIALAGDQVIGMVSVHDRPPFSISERLSDPGLISQPGMKPLEVRLLAIDPSARWGKTFAGLLWLVQAHARAGGCTHLLISGVTERERLYARMGFSRLGPPVASGAARFVPMIADLEKFPRNIQRDIERWEKHLSGGTNGMSAEPLNLNPGPVKTAEDVRKAFGLPPLSHRSREFLFRPPTSDFRLP